MWAISYWIFPAFAAFVWLAMLLAMLLTWIVSWHRAHLPSMAPTQRVAYISDIGATHELKPLFIAMGTTTVVCFTLGFVVERWLRHMGKLAHNTSWHQKVLSFIAIIAAIAGAVGLILLTIFDTLHHHKMHDAMLTLFIVGYVVNAIFICAEYQRLGIYYREFRVLRLSFWFKLAFIFIEIALAIGFGVENVRGKHYNVAAVLEWVIALVFFFYVFSFFADFVPAWQDQSMGKHGRSGPPMEELATAERGGSGNEPLTTDRQADRYGRVNGGFGAGRFFGNGARNGAREAPVNGTF
jgi:hypothetical protein